MAHFQNFFLWKKNQFLTYLATLGLAVLILLAFITATIQYSGNRQMASGIKHALRSAPFKRALRSAPFKRAIRSVPFKRALISDACKRALRSDDCKTMLQDYAKLTLKALTLSSM